MSQLKQRKEVHVDGGSDKNKSKQGRIQDFWKIDLSRGDPGFLEGGSDLQRRGFALLILCQFA